MGFPGIDRADGADPSPVWGPVRQPPFPTNAWYLNLVSHRAADAPDESTRAYTVPYVVDTAPALDGMAGIRLHWPVVQASPKNVQMVSDGHSGISLGTVDPAVAAGYVVDGDTDLSLLGVSLRWGGGRGTGTKGTKGMTTHIVRGMPYGTVRYHGGALPSLHSYNAPASPPLIDGGTELQCGVMDEGGGVAANTTAVARSEVLLHFRNSDFTWALFFSRPVELSCGVSEGDVQVAQFVLSVADTGGGGGGGGDGGAVSPAEALFGAGAGAGGDPLSAVLPSEWQGAGQLSGKWPSEVSLYQEAALPRLLTRPDDPTAAWHVQVRLTALDRHKFKLLSLSCCPTKAPPQPRAARRARARR